MLMTQKERKLKQAEEDVQYLLDKQKSEKDSESFHRINRTIAIKKIDIKRLQEQVNS
jgi:hypothetical protein